MLKYTILVCILCSASAFRFKRPDAVCDVTDFKCVAEIARNLLQTSLPGVAEIGVEPLDPMHHEVLEDRRPDSEIYLTDSTVRGFNDIIFNEVTLYKKDSKRYIHCDISFPHFEMTGHFKLNGKINDVNLKGEGTYSFNTTNVHVVFETLKGYYDKDGKTYLKLTIVSSEIEISGDVQTAFQNSGNDAFPEPIHKFLNENSKVLTKLWKDKINIVNLGKMIDSFNKILATVPLDELISGEI